jgi:tetratricopeptide (TPR) repeat protein
MQTATGNLRFELDRFEAAANAFADVVAREPAYPGAHFRLAVCLLRLDKVEEAASEFRLAATLSDGDWEARLGAGLCDLKRGRGQDALIWFQQGIAAKPNDATALLGRAASLELAGRAGEALDAYRDLADREPSLEGVRDRLVSIRLAKGDWTGAAADARVLLDREPNNIRALTAMAASELKQGRLDGAAGYAARLTKAAPASFEAWITLARCHQAAGRAPEALSAFREAARMRPDSADLQLILATVQLGQNDSAGARRSLEAALKIDPKHTSAIELLAELAEKGGDLAEAERMWTRLAAAVPPEKSGAATLHAGAVRLQMGDAAGAVDAFAKYLELDPESMEARVNLGIAQWRSGEAGAAVETLQDVIASHPGLAEAWYAYAYAAIDIEDYAAAKKAFEALAGLGDRSAEVAYNLGLLLQQAGELDAAQSQYLRALEERPSLREAMERLGQIEQSRGNTEEAKSWWARLRDASAKPSEPKRAEAVGKK